MRPVNQSLVWPESAECEEFVSRTMKADDESCGAQAAQAKEATSTGATVFEIPERGAQEPTPAWVEMGDADPSLRPSESC
jgi:hypothetical protein